MIVRRLVFEDAAQTFRVVLRDEVVKHMFRLCDANRAQETGGILIGSYSHDYTTAEIIEATSPPADSKFGRDWFHRGTDGLEELLVARWNSQPRTHYVGEWHFHTANVPWPSPQDESQMSRTATDPRYHCREPILIIVFQDSDAQLQLKLFLLPGTDVVCELRAVERDWSIGGRSPCPRDESTPPGT